jgi:hypothetical protein
LFALIQLTGCANYIFESFDLDRGRSLSIDAKQRLLLVTHEGGKAGNKKIVCAEPSPDAYSASSASASASSAFSFPTLIPGASGNTAGSTNAGAGLAAARSEAAASLAMRTQTIQLLRDGLYRACEAYMNGAIDQYQYNIVLLNIDRLMITLLGVDAIGGTQKVPPTMITAGAPSVSTSASLKPDGQGAETSAGGKVEGGSVHNEIHITETPKADPSGAQAEAIANIVLAANAHSSVPSLCISLLASGELRLDNPSQRSVFQSCDYLLHGAVRQMASRPLDRAPTAYHMSQQAQKSGTPPPALQNKE